MKFQKLLIIAISIFNLQATTIKDLANVVGVRDNQLIGYGLVVGLNGTGDGSTSKFTSQSISNMLQTVGVKMNQNDIKAKNVAAVMVTATLPPFARQGDKLDVVISSLGDAKSLQGGTLLLTALKGVDGDIYALAQGPLSIGGITNARNGGNHQTVATMLGGALVEKEINYNIANTTYANLSLNSSNFSTAALIEKDINAKFPGVALAIDSRTIKINKPDELSMVDFLARVLSIDVDYKPENKIVVDERTGTIVSGVGIEVDPVVITHGNITLKIDPNSYTKNQNDSGTDLKDGTFLDSNNNTLAVSGTKTTVANVARALTKLGATPKDIISIFENLKRVGAIQAKLEII